ncbi:MAG: glycosyltransferase family 2 protein [Candidatus Dependentiae bacterium]|nr:glycosyltransferase family 2 protein [Candidatus Dependentiae bacterium]
MLLGHQTGSENKNLVGGMSLLALLVSCFCLQIPIKTAYDANKRAGLVVSSHDGPLQLYALLESAHEHLAGVEQLSVVYRASSEDLDALYDRVQRDFPETLFLKQRDTHNGQDYKQLLLRAVAACRSEYVILAADDCIVIDDIDVSRAINSLEQKNAYAFYFNLGANIPYTPKRPVNGPPPPHKQDAETISWNFCNSAGIWAQSAMIDMTLFKKEGLLQELRGIKFTNQRTLKSGLHALHQERYKRQAEQLGRAGASSQRQHFPSRGLAPLHAQAITLTFNSSNRRPGQEPAYAYTTLDLARMFAMGCKIAAHELYHLDTPTTTISLLPHFVLRHKQPDYRHKHIVVVVPSYNNKDWYQKNLDSIFMQDYDNFDVIYIDDRSPDGTGDLVEQYIREKQEGRINLIKNTERNLALKNIYRAIHSCADDDIIVCLDGDDWLADTHVLALVNDLYQDPGVWLTYGQYSIYPFAASGWLARGCCAEIPAAVIEKNAFRSFTWVASHVRTFYAGLFKQIELDDLLYNGEFFAMTWDQAFMFPMLEMARNNHFRFVPAILYLYNTANSINDHKVSRKLQVELEQIIRARRRYETVDDYHRRA